MCVNNLFPTILPQNVFYMWVVLHHEGRIKTAVPALFLARLAGTIREQIRV